jgi:hypothetical protein
MIVIGQRTLSAGLGLRRNDHRYDPAPGGQRGKGAPANLACFAAKNPPPAKVPLVGGGSDDQTVTLSSDAGFSAITP